MKLRQTEQAQLNIHLTKVLEEERENVAEAIYPSIYKNW